MTEDTPIDQTAQRARSDTVVRIPLDRIDADALPRDRSAPDEEALAELQNSIHANGLRMPIEVWELAEPEPPHRYGLISGWRRLEAYRQINRFLYQTTDEYHAIPAFVRTLDTLPARLAAVAEENAIRDQITPWEQGRFILAAVDAGAYYTIEEAVAGLFPTRSPAQQWRIRSLARAAEEFGNLLTEPQMLSMAQLLRMEAACRKGYSEDLTDALRSTYTQSAASQREAMEPVLREAEAETPPAQKVIPETRPGDGSEGRSGNPRHRPKRIVKIEPDLVIRRERMASGKGFRLILTGPAATNGLMEEIMTEIEERWGAKSPD